MAEPIVVAPSPEGKANVAFLLGLFCITCATLLLEILNTRLLSVVTWYHLSFFAVSMAMFGMSVGALWVYLQPRRFDRESPYDALFTYAGLFAVATIACHLLTISTALNIERGWTARAVVVLGMMTVATAMPFFLSGVVVTLALTKVRRNSGLIYAIDLFGAASGCILSLLLLDRLDITSATFVTAAVGLAGMVCFHHARRARWTWGASALTAAGALVFAAALGNHVSARGIRVRYPKGHAIAYSESMREYWSIHGQILLYPAEVTTPFYWGAGDGVPHDRRVEVHPLLIDGEAATPFTRWSGDPATLEWTQYDVTALPYHLRPRSDVVVIGVGGGRDVLAALWAGSRSIIGVEINKGIVELLGREKRDFVNLVTRDDVVLVHDEARSFLTRTTDKAFDVIQMSLIDTWAATGAGAFTLSENGLYTVEAWQMFLEKLTPTGILSVSRWYSPDNPSETTRLLSLAVMALLQRGVERPADHLVVVARASVATLLASPEPFSPDDVTRVQSVADRFGFEILHAPGRSSRQPVMAAVLGSASHDQLERATNDPHLDLSPPTDSRPYFFNVLKPTALLGGAGRLGGVIASGNILATKTLLILCAMSVLGVAVVIIGPLIKVGRPRLPAGVFPSALLYFALIGTGFMMVQIPLIQRFSVYLGHPVYAVAVLLFSMILAAGVGSSLSDRIRVDGAGLWTVALPLGIAASLTSIHVSSNWIITQTIELSLVARALIVVSVVSCAALPMGMCFPLGLRLFRERADQYLPWMWGINGATGVLASVMAVAISMWSGINTSLSIAIVCYALLALPASFLNRSRRWAAGTVP